MSYISEPLFQFKYFDSQLGRPQWRGKRVLDFGGNTGNTLLDPNVAIDRDQYWCVDVSRDAIERGRKAFPEAHWIFYDRYNFAFNSSGVKGLPIPDLGEEFDYIISYSVFTHTSKAEMLELAGQLIDNLAPGGVLAFTFIDHRFNPATSAGNNGAGFYNGSYLRQVLEDTAIEERRRRQGYNAVYDREYRDGTASRLPKVDVESLLSRAAGARWCTLINERDLYVAIDEIDLSHESENRSILTLYRDDYMSSLFKGAKVLPPPYEVYAPTAESVLQHCCVLRKPAING